MRYRVAESNHFRVPVEFDRNLFKRAGQRFNKILTISLLTCNINYAIIRAWKGEMRDETEESQNQRRNFHGNA